MKPASTMPAFKIILSCAVLAGLSACAGAGGAKHVESLQEAVQYQARAASSYTPPGPPEDPWGPYVVEASKRFDVPERWIREVIRQESGGRLYSQAGGLTTSPVGAMGLMQVMPETYDGLRGRYNLGDDPYDPHNNLLAGTAYVREMYDLYGSPGFLAAYNAGPGRLDDYLYRNRSLPTETRKYVAAIGPYIADSYPNSRSPVEQYAMNAGGMSVSPSYARTRPASRDGADVEVAMAPVQVPNSTITATDPAPSLSRAAQLRMASVESPAEPIRAPLPDLPVPPLYPSASPPVSRVNDARGERLAMVTPVEALPEPPRLPTQAGQTGLPVRGGGLHFIPTAMAEPMPNRRSDPAVSGAGKWAVQVGAFGNEAQAQAAAGAARDGAGGRPSVGSVSQGRSTLYRARVVGLSREAAMQACERLGRHGNCMVISPESAS